jgi:hypothetical protein
LDKEIIVHKFLEDAIKAKDDNLTLFESLMFVIEKQHLDIIDVGKVVKKNKIFLSMLQRECKNNNMLFFKE